MSPATTTSWGRHARPEEDAVTDTPEPAELDAELDAEPEAKPRRRATRTAECNVPGCEEPPLPGWRGLCGAHYQTHRGYVGPKEKP